MELLENDLVEGSSGRFGKRLIYGQRGHKTIIARRPAKKRNPKTPRQVEVRNLFSEAVLYARAVIADEVKKALYQSKVRGNQSAFNLALSDFCKAPEIKKYNVTDYTGQIDDKISIRAFDDFKVESVEVIIKDSTDSTIEEGPALLSANGADWIYTATVANPVLPGSKLIISVADIPGNITTEEVVL